IRPAVAGRLNCVPGRGPPSAAEGRRRFFLGISGMLSALLTAVLGGAKDEGGGRVVRGNSGRSCAGGGGRGGGGGGDCFGGCVGREESIQVREDFGSLTLAVVGREMPGAG